MSGCLNKVTLIGHLGNDPEIRTTQDGRELASFSIATTESWKDRMSGERKDKTEWHRIVVFNDGLVKIIKEYVKKGNKIYIEGQLQTRKWNDEKSGQEKYTTEVILQNYSGSLILLGANNNPNNNLNQYNNNSNNHSYNNRDSNNYNNTNNNFENSTVDDEIPF